MIRAILFDAMETIVDINPVPDNRLRVQWTVEHSKTAKNAYSLEKLHSAFAEARAVFDGRVAELREYRSTE